MSTSRRCPSGAPAQLKSAPNEAGAVADGEPAEAVELLVKMPRTRIMYQLPLSRPLSQGRMSMSSCRALSLSSQAWKDPEAGLNHGCLIPGATEAAWVLCLDARNYI